ncbi:hypothetical protein BGZ70_007096 [Mortierella alpina]|uniref:F-box domain-containing protein n=1 Tax=Mortierella alpina TaxID=64518 RepID=A0A9P6J7I3_MORAP|nr:hypothetical protein BGZ70_007096 [Mortierella alpina]
MSELAAIRVFEIPELAILIFDRLNRADLAACAQVHRTWHDAVIPFHYASVMIGKRYRSTPLETRVDTASWEGFKKHSRHMRELEVHGSSIHKISLFGLHCTGLRTLSLDISDDTFQHALWAGKLLKLISNNPDISTLRLKSHCESAVIEFEHHFIVLSMLRYMPGLKKLIIVGSSLGQNAVDEIMRCAHRLEELDVTMDTVDRDPILPTTGRIFWIVTVANVGKGVV